MRFISFTYNAIEKSLDVNVETAMQGKFESMRGGNYFYDEGIIKKYLDFSMYYNGGEYYSKKYIKVEQA